MGSPKATLAVLVVIVALLLATVSGKATCEVPFRKSKSLTKAQLLEVATLAFKGDCKIGEFPGLKRSIDTLCYDASYSEGGCSNRRTWCQRLISADGSAVLAVNDDQLAPIGLYYANDGLSFATAVLAKNKKEIDLVKDWAEDSDDEGKKVFTERIQDFNVSIDGVKPNQGWNICPKPCMTSETLARVSHIKLWKYGAQKVLCHSGNCMTPQHNVLHMNGFETMESYCRRQQCTVETADVYKAIVIGFARSGGIVLSMVYGTGWERVATGVLQVAVWAAYIFVSVLFSYAAVSFSFRSISRKTRLLNHKSAR